MRIIDTQTFIDPRMDSLNNYYNSIIGQNPWRALLELRAYHLPMYFTLDKELKIRINNTYRTIDYKIEHKLMTSSVDETLIATCPKCQRNRKLVALGEYEFCVSCWVNTLHHIYALWRSEITWMDKPPLKYFSLEEHLHQSAKVPGYEWFWDVEEWKPLAKLHNIAAMKKDFHFLLQARVHTKVEDVGHSPKKALFASLIGCTKCGVQKFTSNVWTQPANDWDDGTCPNCTPEYTECTRCGSETAPYAMWGMCVDCYVELLDSFMDYDVLTHVTKQYGLLATLLLSVDSTWPAYIRGMLPRHLFKGLMGNRFPRNELMKVQPIDVKSIVQQTIRSKYECSMTRES